MEKLTDIQKGIAEKRPASMKLKKEKKIKKHSVEEGSETTIEQTSSVLIGYIVSYKSFSSCMAHAQLQQLQKHDTVSRREDTEGMLDEISRDQSQESVFTDPYNAEDGKKN
ncbi:1607_t:CDS:2 [Racocetra fulgida]|uniref:1607_t:CDS:1 n=1 Tax=Racocetra fulgida TaxID=60492 RepID=A0A9N8ZE65_9GLOM|nr:1607_t:CDS:2 [Racocetra fulgida]